MQKLISYLEKTGLTGQEFAALVGTEPSTISRLINNKCKPRISLALKIQSVTRGRVKVADWIPKQ